MPIYLEIPGIKGDATHDTHKDWMDIEALDWRVERRIITPSGSSANREAKEPFISEITMSKISDSSATELFKQSCTGAKSATAKIHLVTTGSPSQTYIEYTLTDTLIASYSVSTNGDRPFEVIRLNFSKIEIKYTPYNDKHEAQSPKVASYDLSTTKSA